jgi:hypothetical protein
MTTTGRRNIPKPPTLFRNSRPIALALGMLTAGFGSACTGDSPDLTAPAALSSGAGPGAQFFLGDGTHGHPLTAITGQGTGHVNITPEASQEGFSVEVQVSVRWTEPDAEFLLTRSVDFVPDGECTGTMFTPLPLPNPGPIELLRTSPAGAGAKHASFAFTPPPPAPFADGEQFDVHWEIRTLSNSTVLRSPCITVTVR